MSFDNTKHDVEINGISHRIRGYSKNEAPSFVPRISSSGQSETEFNTLLSKTVKSFAGGILQRMWEDDNSVFAAEGLYPLFDDGVIYPVNDVTTSTSLGSGRPVFQAFAQTKDYLYIAWQSTNGGAQQGIKRIDTSGTITSLTVPTNISNQTYIIYDMVIWGTQLWVSGIAPSMTSGTMYYMETTATSLGEITVGDAGTYFYKMVIYKGQLYGTNVVGNPNHAISRYTGNTATKSYQPVGFTPVAIGSYYARLFIFNNRIHLSRNDGLYAYDGTQLTSVIDMVDNVDDKNFALATVLKGYLYYFMPDGFYRYNGATIEKLYDISEVGTPTDMRVGKNRLWLSYANSSYSGSSRYDKSMGYDYSGGNTSDGRVMVFDGKAMFTYRRTSTFTKSGSPLLAREGENDKVVWFNNKLYVLTFAEPANTQYVIDTNELAVSGAKSWRVVTSIFDGDFPMVDKNLDNLEIVFDGTVSSDETIDIEYRTTGFGGSTGWTTLGSFKTQTRLKEHIWRNIPAGVTFRKIQFRLVGSTTAGYGIAKFITRYTLSPDFKWQWVFTVLNYGDDSTQPLMLADGSSETQDVQTLRGNLYAARSSDVPVKYVDIDQLDLNGAINAAVTTINVNSTKLLKGDSGFIQIDDEVIYWSAKTTTQLTVTRGALGTVAATHADNAKVFIVYRVLVSQIQNEFIEMQDDGIDRQEDKSRSSEVTLQLREV